MTTYPAITIMQPWATWIALGLKTVETRSHKRFARLVGKRIAIHAGKKFDTDGYSTGIALMTPQHRARLDSSPLPYTDLYRHSAVIALATVEAFSPARGLDDRALRYCGSMWGLWLVDVEPIGPYPVRGHQGIWTWTVPEEMQDAL